MPPAVDSSEHVRFLVNCIKHAKDGKVDFQAVADDFGIVSKAAAGKRYERLLKAHDITTNKLAVTAAATATSSGSDPAGTPTNVSPKKEAAAAPTGRKRGRPAAVDGDGSPTKKPRGCIVKSKANVKDYTSSEGDTDSEGKPKIKSEGGADKKPAKKSSKRSAKKTADAGVEVKAEALTDEADEKETVSDEKEAVTDEATDEKKTIAEEAATDEKVAMEDAGTDITEAKAEPEED